MPRTRRSERHVIVQIAVEGRLRTRLRLAAAAAAKAAESATAAALIAAGATYWGAVALGL